MKTQPGSKIEDVWIPTSCGGCYGQCGIKVRRKNGVVVEITGNPETPAGEGRICAKGTSQLMTLYDPHRINYPVKRGNPKKGVHENPRWERISWDEAMDTIVSKLKAVYEKDPRGIYWQATIYRRIRRKIIFYLHGRILCFTRSCRPV